MTPEQREKLQNSLSSVSPSVRNLFIETIKLAHESPKAAKLCADFLSDPANYLGNPSSPDPSEGKLEFLEFLDVLREILSPPSDE